jgi:hypothetical protein
MCFFCILRTSHHDKKGKHLTTTSLATSSHLCARKTRRPRCWTTSSTCASTSVMSGSTSRVSCRLARSSMVLTSRLSCGRTATRPKSSSITGSSSRIRRRQRRHTRSARRRSGTTGRKSSTQRSPTSLRSGGSAFLARTLRREAAAGGWYVRDWKIKASQVLLRPPLTPWSVWEARRCWRILARGMSSSSSSFASCSPRARGLGGAVALRVLMIAMAIV